MEENKEKNVEVNNDQQPQVVPTIEEKNNQNNMENEVTQELMPVKNNHGLIGFLILVIALLMAGLVYVLFFTGDEKKGSNPTPTPTAIPTDDPLVTPPLSPQETANINEEEMKYELNGSDYGKNWVIKTTSKDAKIIKMSWKSGNYVLYNDNGLKLYDVETNKSTSINLENNYKEYEIVDTFDGKVYGISYITNNNKIGYYNVVSNKKMYDGKYTYSDEDSGFSIISDDYMYLISDGKTYLLKSTEEKEVLSLVNDDEFYDYTFNILGNDKPVFVQKLCTGSECFVKKLYDSKMNVFYNGSQYDFFMDYINDNIYILNEKKIEKYDMNGKLISTSKEYNNVLQIIRNYVVYLNNNDLILENIDDNSESKVILQDVQSNSYDSFTSGYYTRNYLDSIDEKNKKEGLYLVIYYGYDDNGAIKDSKGYYGMEYCYTPDKQVVEYPIKEEMGGRAKPVLYLYPEKETDVTVKFEKPELLTTTYPKYTSSWNVRVKPNGDMYDKDGKYYYALYWDEVRYAEVDFSKGFYVEGKEAISFLEEKLSYIGLSPKERNEFIMYWLPIMEKNGKNLVYFELTHEREKDNKLIINPTPDSLLRVSIHIKKVNEKVNIKEQKLVPFNRVGFAAIEWGGMTY